MYPGDKSDYVISKTLTKASKQELFVSSETESSEDSSDEDTVLVKAQATSLFQEMVHVAIKIRTDLKDTQGHSEQWHCLDQEHVEKIIPDSLFLLLSLLFGGTAVLEGTEEQTSESNELKRTVCNVAQDIIYGVSNHKKLTPKHIGPGLALHQATRSENLVQLFNAANHTIGIDTVRRFENAIANNVLDIYRKTLNLTDLYSFHVTI